MHPTRHELIYGAHLIQHHDVHEPQASVVYSAARDDYYITNLLLPAW